MSSLAYTNYLEELLKDAEELTTAHGQLSTGLRGRQWGLGALNRAVVVMSVSAWEAYVEEVLKESVEALRPVAPQTGVWPVLKASGLSSIGRFNTPNPENVKGLVAQCIGLQDVCASWKWRSCSPKKARDKLGEALRYRHQIAHGVNPRPTIHKAYAEWLPGFFRRLGICTDDAIRDYLVVTLGVANPWPP